MATGSLVGRCAGISMLWIYQAKSWPVTCSQRVVQLLAGCLEWCSVCQPAVGACQGSSLRWYRIIHVLTHTFVWFLVFFILSCVLRKKKWLRFFLVFFLDFSLTGLYPVSFFIIFRILQSLLFCLFAQNGFLVTVYPKRPFPQHFSHSMCGLWCQMILPDAEQAFH